MTPARRVPAYVARRREQERALSAEAFASLSATARKHVTEATAALADWTFRLQLGIAA